MQASFLFVRENVDSRNFHLQDLAGLLPPCPWSCVPGPSGLGHWELPVPVRSTQEPPGAWHRRAGKPMAKVLADLGSGEGSLPAGVYLPAVTTHSAKGGALLLLAPGPLVGSA